MGFFCLPKGQHSAKTTNAVKSFWSALLPARQDSLTGLISDKFDRKLTIDFLKQLVAQKLPVWALLQLISVSNRTVFFRLIMVLPEVHLQRKKRRKEPVGRSLKKILFSGYLDKHRFNLIPKSRISERIKFLKLIGKPAFYFINPINYMMILFQVLLLC